MNKNRTKGAIKQAKGTVKEVWGKIIGDPDTEAEGKIEKVEGKVQSSVGEAEDALKDAVHKDK